MASPSIFGGIVGKRKKLSFKTDQTNHKNNQFKYTKVMAHARPNSAAFEILIHLHILRRTKFEQAAPSENVTLCKNCGPQSAAYARFLIQCPTMNSGTP
jgi:hypothetical protein